jgi:chloramphenicol-sensitive protein RarD
MNEIKNKSSYYLAAVVAFFIWGVFSLALKSISAFPSLDILYYRIFFAATILSAFNLAFSRKKIQLEITNWKTKTKIEKRNTLFFTLTGGILLTVNWFIFIYVTNHISIKAAAFAYIICPLITTLLAAVLLNEKLKKFQWIAIGIIFCSCILLGIFSPYDALYSLIVALTYALYLVSQRKNQGLNKLLVLNIQMIFAAIVILPFFPLFVSDILKTDFFFLMIALIAILFTIVPLLLNLYALNGLNSSTIGILLYINPIVNFFVAFFYYNEKTFWYQWIAYSLVIFSILLYNKKIIRGLILKK